MISTPSSGRCAFRRLILVPALTLVSVFFARAAAEQLPPSDRDTYVVYAALFAEFGASVVDRRPLVIRSDTRTRFNLRCLPTGRPIAGEWKPAMDDFLDRNASQRFLNQSLLVVKVPFEIAAWSEIMSGEDTYDGWKNFRARWPKAEGYYDVTAVGFDRGRMRAIVYVGFHSGPGRGEGRYHFLEKKGDWAEVLLDGVDACQGLPFY
jgi:hypothetical protein